MEPGSAGVHGFEACLLRTATGPGLESSDPKTGAENLG